jgi:RHS repeat-associated protein
MTLGKLVSISGTEAETTGIMNPYRYRGYRYDAETGLYYLQSRYYNPEWGRFLNADCQVRVVIGSEFA